MSRFVVFHNYGAPEGWKIVGEFDSMLEAVEAREADIYNGGGVVEIFERQDLYEAYNQARYERDETARLAAKKAV